MCIQTGRHHLVWRCLALSCSLHQASIAASCRSTVLRLSCSLCWASLVLRSSVVLFSLSGKPSFPLLSCPSSVLFCLSGKPSFLLLSCFSSSIKLGALCEDLKLVHKNGACSACIFFYVKHFRLEIFEIAENFGGLTNVLWTIT